MNDTNGIKENEREQSVSDVKTEQELAEINFRKSLKAVSDLYLYTVIISAAVVVAGLVYAVISKVSIGLIIAILGVLIYTALTSNILYKKLGISYRSTSGALTVTQLYGQHRKEIWIPERLLWINVTEIGDRAFAHASSAKIHTVHLPATLKAIGENIFEGCEELKTVYFAGSREEWEQIESSTDFSAYELIFAAETAEEQADSEPEKDGSLEGTEE